MTIQTTILQHVPFEGPAALGPILAEIGAEVEIIKLYENAQLPETTGIDLLIVMGGPMSANDTNTYEWMAEELRLIHECITSGIPTLGICLGAQMMARALGRRVYANAHKEIGWWPVARQPLPDGVAEWLPASATVLHWHGETFDLPYGARLLASSSACANQAFQLGDKAVGLQFHLEATPESLEAICAACNDDITDGQYIQSAADMRANAVQHLQANHKVLRGLLSTLVGQVTN